jgi:protocatechuate 3,4-dioxygenase beta subunit
MKVRSNLDSPASSRPETWLDRRALLRRMVLGLAVVPLVQAACGDDASGVDGGSSNDGSSGDSPDGATGAADGATGAADGATGTADGATGADSATADGWASGGTDAMTDKDSYPDPFTGALTACAVVSGTTQGPCTTSTNLDREDVSEGWTGLPVRLALKIVDGSCDPIAGAVVKIWHTNLEGIYSGQTPNPGMCSQNIAAYIAADFFRGVRTTASDGTVYFDTCFPGWYNGRAIHIHFQVTSGNTTYKISQLFFPESLTEEIFDSHPEYVKFGQPNTTFSNDNVAQGLGLSNMAAYTFEYARMTDGAMLASKVIAVTG